MRLAYADRETWLGDPEFVSVPISGLIDRDYLKQRSALISMGRALNDYRPGTPPGAEKRTAALPQPESGTSHRSEEHTSELPSLMRISYAVFCLKKKNRLQQLSNRRT